MKCYSAVAHSPNKSHYTDSLLGRCLRIQLHNTSEYPTCVSSVASVKQSTATSTVNLLWLTSFLPSLHGHKLQKPRPEMHLYKSGFRDQANIGRCKALPEYWKLSICCEHFTHNNTTSHKYTVHFWVHDLWSSLAIACHRLTLLVVLWTLLCS